MFDMVMNYFDGTPALNVPVDENWLLANYDPSLDLKASDDWNTIVAGIASIEAKAPAFGPLYYADVPENTATIDGMFSVPDYSKGIQARTDAWFTTGTHKCINALTSSGRSGSVRRYLFAEPTPAGVAAFLPTAFGIDFFGAYHGSELTYVWGFYKKAPMQGSYLQAAFFGSSFPAGPTAEQITMGDTMHTYWVDHMKTGSAGSNWPAAVAGQPIPMMVFASLLPGGAAVNPCIQPTACASESAENFRAKKVAFWSGEATTLTPNVPCCTDRRALLFGGQPACDPSPNCESAPYAREACDSPTVLITQNSMYDTSRGVAPALCDA
jgi:hypothetical protein